ncbi:hypothetical protein TNCV_4785951 [Trichonephila clavipes]|nr:hypothetical protein TNCV_4785951 [Trichonephila clavipes]
MTRSVTKSPGVAEQCDVNIHSLHTTPTSGRASGPLHNKLTKEDTAIHRTNENSLTCFYSKRKATLDMIWNRTQGAALKLGGTIKDQAAVARLTAGRLRFISFLCGLTKFTVCAKWNPCEATHRYLLSRVV